MYLQIITSMLLVIGIACLFGLTPERITDDIMALLKPNDSLRDKIKNLRGNKKKRSLYKMLLHFKTALVATGKSKQFVFVCCASVILFAAGIFVSLLVNNVFLMPALSVAFALIPFFYTASMLSAYEKHTREELETTLSIITTSYVRSDDILTAVSENLQYIRPPLNEVFRAFLGDATSVSSNTKLALSRLKEKVDDEIFEEWVETLIQCQDDRTLKDTLQPVVAKLTDVRIVNSELRTMLSSARSEYWVMVALVAGNIPLLYVLNKSWYETLMYSTPGKIVLGICGAVILVTALFMMKFTKPIGYKR